MLHNNTIIAPFGTEVEVREWSIDSTSMQRWAEYKSQKVNSPTNLMKILVTTLKRAHPSMMQHYSYPCNYIYKPDLKIVTQKSATQHEILFIICNQSSQTSFWLTNQLHVRCTFKQYLLRQCWWWRWKVAKSKFGTTWFYLCIDH